MHNSQTFALDEFIKNYEEYMKERFGTKELTKEEVLDKLTE
jgi:hypothetical protein